MPVQQLILDKPLYIIQISFDVSDLETSAAPGAAWPQPAYICSTMT